MLKIFQGYLLSRVGDFFRLSKAKHIYTISNSPRQKYTDGGVVYKWLPIGNP